MDRIPLRGTGDGQPPLQIEQPGQGAKQHVVTLAGTSVPTEST